MGRRHLRQRPRHPFVPRMVDVPRGQACRRCFGISPMRGPGELVRLGYVMRETRGSTPVIVHRIRQDGKGHGLHHFSFRCPRCGGRLPGYRPIPASAIRPMASSMPAPSLFFFDRVSRGAIDMAAAFRKQGALVFFEPSAQASHALFQEALAVSHVVKASRERWAGRRELSPCETNWLLIETLGLEGLRFLSRLPSYRGRGWQHVSGFPLRNYRDTAGAGDWCTAGILACLGTRGAKGLEQVGERKRNQDIHRNASNGIPKIRQKPTRQHAVQVGGSKAPGLSVVIITKKSATAKKSTRVTAILV